MIKTITYFTALLSMTTLLSASVTITDTTTGSHFQITRILSQENIPPEDISTYQYIAYTLDTNTPSINVSLQLTDASGKTWQQPTPTHLSATHNVIQIPLDQISTILDLTTLSKINVFTNAPTEILPTFIQAYDLPQNETKIASSDIHIATSTENAELDLQNCLNVPNPFNPNRESTTITYTLTKDASIDIYIYSLNGELQEKIHLNAGNPGATAGYNAHAWNGKNKYNETVANGIYIAYIISKSEGKTKKGKVKLWVRK